MSLDACVSSVAREMGLDEADVREIADRLVREKARLAAAGRLDTAEADLRAFAKGAADEARVFAALKRKQTALAVLKRDAADRHIDAQVAKGVPLHEAIVSFLVGGVHDRDSVAAGRAALEGKWIAGLHERIATEVPVALEMVKKKDAVSRPFFDDVVREMGELRKDGKPGRTGNADARKLAGILAEHAEATRLWLNKLGANIGKLDGWTGPQRWDVRSLLKAGDKAWVDKVLPGLDVERSFGAGTSPERAAEILRGVWHNLITGRDLKVSGGEKGEHMGPANLARGMEKHRVLHFRDAEAWLAANQAFGRGHVLDGIVDHMHYAARKASLMDKLGANPEVMLRSILETRARELSLASREGTVDPQAAGKMIDRLGLEGTRIGRAYDTVSGSANIPGNVTSATIMRNIRSLVTMAKLGGSLLSQFSDLATYSAAMRDQGRGVWKSHLDALRGVLAGGDKHVARLVGIGADTFSGDINSRFNVDGLVPGLMSKAVESFYKLSGVQWWTERLETAFATMTSHWMATQAARGWDGLSPQYRHLLGLHGIGPAEWEAIRGAVENIGGHDYVLPGKLADTATELKLRQFFLEETMQGVIKGDDRTRLLTTQGTRPGTPLGEAFRTLWQFNSFNVAYTQKALGRAAYGYLGADPSLTGVGGNLKALGQAAVRNTPALASLIVASTLYGWLSMNAKDFAKNRTMKDPARKATWLAALAQGGGAGIFGDYLFGQTDRSGSDLASKFVGPAGGVALDLVALLMKARNTALHPETHGPDEVRASDFINYALNNTPYLNLFYARAALDLAVLNGLQEWASPGSFQRRASNLKQQFGQQYLLSPLAHGVLSRPHYSPRGALE